MPSNIKINLAKLTHSLQLVIIIITTIYAMAIIFIYLFL